MKFKQHEAEFRRFAQNHGRREFLRRLGAGMGTIGLAGLLGQSGIAAATGSMAEDARVESLPPLWPRAPHFAPKAKRVIQLFMPGGPSQVDTFDYKPALAKYAGERPNLVNRKSLRNTQGGLMPSPFGFQQRGQSGHWVSDIFPHVGSVVDDIAFIHSMHTDIPEHAGAILMANLGALQPNRPSMGSWLVYGLGTENQNLPGFVALISGGVSPSGGKDLWGTGFLSSVFQGVQCRSQGEPVLYVSNPKGMNRDVRRLSLDALRDLNELQAQELGSPETRTRIAQYELAYRMQMSVPQAMDLTQEPKHVLDAYGAVPGNGSFNNNVLLARRLVEHGVRFVQLFDWGWDFHGTNASRGIREGLTSRCKPMDQAVGALIADLKERGLLDETLIVWGGEFGRTPFREGRTSKSNVLGRDHFPDCYSMFMAGGGIKPGISYGESDPLGFTPAVDKVHVHDLQATILHTLGLNHEKLTHRFQGRDYRLTDVHGEVVEGLLA